MAIKIANIQRYEDVAAMEHKDLEKLGINPDLYWGYWRAKQVENEYIDLGGCIWGRDVEGIVNECRANGVKRITTSSTYSGMTELLWEFAKHGCKVVGLMQVATTIRNYDNNEYEKVPAIIIEISDQVTDSMEGK